MKRLTILALTALISSTVFFSACPKKKSAGTPVGGPGAIEGMEPGGALAERPEGISKTERGKFEPVYFAYDSAAVNPNEGTKLDAVANFLRTDSTGVILVEGHCDEKGTAEYNRALGERRALAAREELIHRGADAARIQTISYGKDRPADTGHTEAAMAKNRRDEFVIVRP